MEESKDAILKDISEHLQKLTLLVHELENTNRTLTKSLKDTQWKKDKDLSPLQKDLKQYQSDVVDQKSAAESHMKKLEKLQGFFTNSLNSSFVFSFVDLYNQHGKDEQSAETSVHRYGINTADIDKNLQEFLGDRSEGVVLKTKSGSSVGGSNASELSIKIVNFLEILSLKRAMGYLHDHQDSKAVLVDIFARDAEGVILSEGTGGDLKLGVHTIVLCKGPDLKTVVIDPNNSKSSKHIGFNAKLFLEDADLVQLLKTSQDGTKIKTAELRIYERADGGVVGPKPDEYRDCIDIAVKLGFGLQKMKESFLDPYKPEVHHVVRIISNQEDLNDLITDTKGPIRATQASNAVIVESIAIFEQLIDQGLKWMQWHNVEKYQELKNKHKALLANNSFSHLDFVESLSKCNDEINAEMIGSVKAHGEELE